MSLGTKDEKSMNTFSCHDNVTLLISRGNGSSSDWNVLSATIQQDRALKILVISCKIISFVIYMKYTVIVVNEISRIVWTRLLFGTLLKLVCVTDWLKSAE